jgi:hypothetical protein
MKRKERSSLGVCLGLGDIQKNAKLFDSNSNFESENDTYKTRKQYNLAEKKSYVKKYYDFKEEYQNKGIRPIEKILGIPFSCLQEWIKQYQFIKLKTNKKGKFRLQAAGRLLSTLAIEDELMKWVCEQKRCDIGITTQEITNKSIELDEN